MQRYNKSSNLINKMHEKHFLKDSITNSIKNE